MNTDKTKDTERDLRFKNGKFRILAVSDLHGINNPDRRLVRDLEALLDTYKPDLLLVLGDVVWRDAANNSDTLREFLSTVFDCVEKRNIPWAHTFGNHDEEHGFTASEQQGVYEKFEHNISLRSPAEVRGVSNYVLPVKSEDGAKTVYNVWMLDSGRDMHEYLTDCGFEDDYRLFKMEEPLHRCATYDAIRFSQIKWYYELSCTYQQENGGKVPGLMCFHIPLPEYQVLYKNVAETHCRGNRRESIGCSPINSGLFSALLERGDIKTVVCGHDHINDYDGTFLDIKLAYDGGLSYDGYCDTDMRGGRIVDIVEDDPWNVKTYMVRAADCVKDYPGEEDRKVKTDE